MTHKVEIQRTRGGLCEDEDAEFSTIEEAREWADTMRQHYGYRKVWIDGLEYSGKGN